MKLPVWSMLIKVYEGLTCQAEVLSREPVRLIGQAKSLDCTTMQSVWQTKGERASLEHRGRHLRCVKDMSCGLKADMVCDLLPCDIVNGASGIC